MDESLDESLNFKLWISESESRREPRRESQREPRKDSRENLENFQSLKLSQTCKCSLSFFIHFPFAFYWFLPRKIIHHEASVCIRRTDWIMRRHICRLEDLDSMLRTRRFRVDASDSTLHTQSFRLESHSWVCCLAHFYWDSSIEIPSLEDDLLWRFGECRLLRSPTMAIANVKHRRMN